MKEKLDKKPEVKKRQSVFHEPGESEIFSRAVFFAFGNLIRSIEQAPNKRLMLAGILLGLPIIALLLLCSTPIDPILVMTGTSYERPSIIYGHDPDGKPVPIAEFYRFSRRVIDLGNEETRNSRVVQSFVATEDNNFFSRWIPGVDIQGIMRATVVNIMAGRIKEGASTITQQVARLKFLSSERSMFRKLREALLAVMIDLRYSKKQILEMYLNEVPLGHGTLGVEAAADFYFNKSYRDLSWGESALLASLTTRPRDFSPLTNPNESRQKVRVVLKKLVETGTISVKEAEDAYLDLEEQYYSSLNRSPNDTAFNKRLNLYPYVTEYVRTILTKDLKEKLESGGLRIQTSIEVNHQKAAEEAMTPMLARLTEQRKRRPFRNFFAFDDEMGRFLPLIQEIFYPGFEYRVKKSRVLAEFEKEFLPDRADLGLLNLTSGDENIGSALERSIMDAGLEEEQRVEGSLISMRIDGGVTAVIGGSSFTAQNQLLRFLTSKRQPGSAFKPIFYAAGIEETGLNPGTERPLTAATMIDDSPVQFVSSDLSEYSPDNYSETYEGPMRLRRGLTFSKNSVAIRVYERLGASRLNPIAEKILGFDMANPPRSLPREATVALGSVELTTMEMLKAYGVFASGGYEVKPYLIETVHDANGKLLLDNITGRKVKEKRILSAGACQIITSMLKDVIREGTGTGAALPGREAAGKTGTTNRSTDAWFIGYTPELMAAIQIGYDTNRTLGSGSTGGALAAPAWARFMNRALAGEKAGRFDFPGSNVVYADVCEDTGMLPTEGCKTITEMFLPGTVPKTAAKEFRKTDESGEPVRHKREEIFSEKDF